MTKPSTTKKKKAPAVAMPLGSTIPPELLKAIPAPWQLRELQGRALQRTWEALNKPENEYVVLEAPPGVGKCHGRGTPILKFDGTVIPAEQVREADQLMGPDSTPRRVVATTTGWGPLFRIEPKKGTPWVCNDMHVLTVVNSETDDVSDIPLREYLAQAPSRKHHQKQFHVGVTFPTQAPLPLDPYFFGVWLGDGRVVRGGTSQQSYYLHGSKRGGSNPLLEQLRSIVGVTTIVPHMFLTASRADRLALLAGLVDTDGHLVHNCYEVTQKNRGIADAIVFLARSLGLQATIRVKEVPGYGIYHRTFISGNTDCIPCRIPRKRAGLREQKKNVTRTSFTVMPLGDGEFFGFAVDGDHRYLLGDFAVTHNSLLAITLARAYGPTAILTSTVQLQEQYLSDFGSSGLRVLKGRKNFRCSRAHDTCEVGARLNLGCTNKAEGTTCPYRLAKEEAFDAPILNANYHSFWRHMGKAKGADEDGAISEHRKLLVVDEAHRVEDTVMSLAELTVRLSDIPITLPVLPTSASEPEPYYEWLDKVKNPLATLMSQLHKEGNLDDEDKVDELLNRIEMVQQARRKLEASELDTRTEYIVERGTMPDGKLDENWFSLKPLHVRHIANRIWAGFPKVLFMSATILNAWEFCTALGLDLNKGEFVPVDESFPSENRPIHLGALDMSYGARDESWPMMVNIIANLMRFHDTQKGLILTSSNVMMKYIMKELGKMDRTLQGRLIPAFGEDRLEKYHEHLRAKGPTVLIASGYWEGADLKDDASRFAIIPSLPRAMFTGQVKARAQLEPRWYRWATLTKTLQGIGRSVRSEKDEAVTYILDREFGIEMGKKDSMIPNWVRVAVRKKEGQ